MINQEVIREIRLLVQELAARPLSPIKERAAITAWIAKSWSTVAELSGASVQDVEWKAIPTMLKTIIRFRGIAPEGSITSPHGLRINGQSVQPSQLTASRIGFHISILNTTHIVAERINGDSPDVDVFAEVWLSARELQRITQP